MIMNNETAMLSREVQRNVEKCTALCISDDMMIIIDILEYWECHI